MSEPAALLLADGSRFEGEGLQSAGLAVGEAVFYTGMTGYEEALTDPSYAGQILTFTYPLIGNYGVSGEAAQYSRACVAGAVIKRLAPRHWHHAATGDLRTWLEEQHVPTLLGADTRSLTIALREHGTLPAALAIGARALERADERLAEFARAAPSDDLVAGVATRREQRYGAADGGPRVVVLDCGVKRAVIRELLRLDASVVVLPYDANEAQVSEHDPDAIVISPGPGDPVVLQPTVDVLRGLLGKRPMFGVCLGHQLLALACGARTYKLPYGHRGGNQPVKDLLRDRVLVTAHNHGYAVDGASLPSDLEATMTNLNDGTNEGFRHRELPVAGVQFHPEASPGPYDARHLFADWFASLP